MDHLATEKVLKRQPNFQRKKEKKDHKERSLLQKYLCCTKSYKSAEGRSVFEQDDKVAGKNSR